MFINGYLSDNIKQLPQLLQDYIGEFNVEHRKYMKDVLEELKIKIFYKEKHSENMRENLNSIKYLYGELNCSCCNNILKRRNEMVIMIGDFYIYCDYDCYYNDRFL